MIIFEETKKVDERHTVATRNSISYAVAIQVNEDGTYSEVLYKDDDQRSWDNRAVIDATEEEKKAYKKYMNKIEEGDTVQIVSGRKMKGEIKTVAKIFDFVVGRTEKSIEYLAFTDNTKVQKFHCKLV